VTALYFTIDAFLKKYLLMYVFVTKTESGGKFWVTMFNRVVFATVLADVVIGVVVKARGNWTLVAAIAPLLIIMIAFKWYCRKTFDLDLAYYARGGMQDQERLAADGKPQRVEKIASKFGHPALYKPLMTPMVHAKAKHILAQIYRGRLNSEGGQSMAFSDIAMQPMSQSGKPDQDVPFEIVPESQQDFQFYRNRADFREEGGDIFSDSRSQTPVSHIGKEEFGSPSSSRQGSPAPRPGQQHSIPRRPFDQSHVPSQFRSTPLISSDGGDLGMRHGAYTDADDDRANLLGGVGDAKTPTGEFLSLDRWRASGGSRDGNESYHDTSTANTPAEELNSGYDYFRGRR